MTLVFRVKFCGFKNKYILCYWLRIYDVSDNSREKNIIFLDFRRRQKPMT